VFIDESNHALSKIATQSTVWIGGYPYLAVDGIKNPVYSLGSCIHTFYNANEWWAVDLDAIFPIRQVIITNRADTLCKCNIFSFL
jgi:hypothetical protein